MLHSRRILTNGLGCAVALILSAGAVFADPKPPAPQPEQRFVTSDGHVWERMQIQHTDVRSLTVLLGGQVLPTEMDLYRMRMGAYGSLGKPIIQNLDRAAKAARTVAPERVPHR